MIGRYVGPHRHTIDDCIEQVLDRPSADPDDDAAMAARAIQRDRGGDWLSLRAIVPFQDHHPRGDARCECGWRPNLIRRVISVCDVDCWLRDGEGSRLWMDRPGAPMTTPRAAQEEAVDWEQMKATERWMRRQRMLSPFRRAWHRLLGHEVGRYACFTCDMDLP